MNGTPTGEVVAGVRRLAVVSAHTSPLDQPGTGDGGGLNVYVLETARALAARGLEIDVFTRRCDPRAPETVAVADGLRVHHVTAGPVAPVAKEELPSHLCAFLLETVSLCERRGIPRPDAIHAHYWMSGWVGRRLRERWGAPLVQSFHTLGRVKNAVLAPGDVPEPPLRLLAEAQLVEEADRIVVSVCGEARHLHERHGASGGRISVVRPGVDLDTFRPGPRCGGPRTGAPLLLFVGRLQPLKAPDVAVRALAAVRREIPSARLLAVGGRSGRRSGRSGPRALRRLATELGVEGALELLPAQPQPVLAELYRDADLTLVPSRSESFGLVALESQACGTPVVAAEVGGLRAVVEGGVLVPGHDPEDHAAAAVGLLSDPDRYATVVDEGLRHARRASWQRTADGLLDVYGSLTDRGRATVEAVERAVGA
jgi:D-inositol-3-phosphate glycosyltransferase